MRNKVGDKMSKKYVYDSTEPVHVNLSDLEQHQADLLSTSETFCIYPWIHLHTYPTGETYPCCHANMHDPIGTTKENTLKELWHSSSMKELRLNMMNNRRSHICNGCYEQEASGFFSGRKSANKHHGHHIARVEDTKIDGAYWKFNMTYWDIRFSNLCNLSCRTCGYIFSSSWYKDQVELAKNAGDLHWAENNKVMNIAGRYDDDMLEQVLEHIDSVEQIYFAGGEPLTMHEHYAILDELVKRKRFDVRLIYNTNFTKVTFKDKTVFDYWKLFDSVSVGASLDADGYRAEYIRTGTNWDLVVKNREQMQKECPKADFYISATVSILNALHVPDFHEAWVKKGLIQPQDFNINILQDPMHYRIDIAPKEYKVMIDERYQQHIKWLEDKDPLNRASIGFKSALKFMWATNNSHLVPVFWQKTNELDDIRNQKMLDFIPELKWCVVI